MKGIIFDIKEFAINDGDGIRTTVFLKGCPLRCIWCHNPEGLSTHKELYIKSNGCTNCGLCRQKCDHEDCKPFERCIHICPQNLVTVSGEEWDSVLLANKLLKHTDFLNAANGGVTLSGGEPLLQANFCLDILQRLKDKTHRAIETSGYADLNTFKKIISECELVIMDIKIADPKVHKEYTGVTNEMIIENAKYLKHSGIAHIFRTPLIPGITDSVRNLTEISKIIGDSRTELLPYNTLAGAKYKGVGRDFTDKINESLIFEWDYSKFLSLFQNAKIKK